MSAEAPDRVLWCPSWTHTGIIGEKPQNRARDAAGTVTGALGMATDITGCQLATDLREKLGALGWTADAETLRFTVMSGRARELVGRPVDEWLGRADFLERILHPDERDTSLG